MIIEEIISGEINIPGKESIQLTDHNVISASCKYQCCADGTFEIGGVYASSLELVCRLEHTNRFQVKGAEIIVYSKYASESEPYCIGKFWAVSVQRTGDIYTIQAMDAIGWLDCVWGNGSVAQYIDEYIKTYVPTVQGLFAKLTNIANICIRSQIGLTYNNDPRWDLLKWEDYDDKKNAFFGNQHHWVYAINAENQGYWYPRGNLCPRIWYDDWGMASDIPRDYFSYLAELTGGFIFADNERNGSLTLGQFGMVQYDQFTENCYTPQKIAMSEVELDSCEIADYILFLTSSYVAGRRDGLTSCSNYSYAMSPDYINIHWNIDNNPFLNGLTSSDTIIGMPGDLAYVDPINVGLRQSYYHDFAYRNGKDDTEIRRQASTYTIRPFFCTVHSGRRFHLGQKIVIQYKDFTEPEEKDYHSIITSIQWTFRGGHQLACGGDDDRVMTDCIRASKGDRAIKMAQNCYNILNNRTLSMK